MTCTASDLSFWAASLRKEPGHRYASAPRRNAQAEPQLQGTYVLGHCGCPSERPQINRIAWPRAHRSAQCSGGWHGHATWGFLIN